MSSAPTTDLIKRPLQTMQITIDDEGVHLIINNWETPYTFDEHGNPTPQPTTTLISLTMQEAVDIGDVWSMLRFETPALFNGKPVPPALHQGMTCTNCFGSGSISFMGMNFQCNDCMGRGYLSRHDREDTHTDSDDD